MILVILFSLFATLLIHSVWTWTYFIRKGIKGPRGFPILGLLHETLTHEDPLFLKLGHWTKKYGPVYGFMEGPQKTLVISEPEMVDEIFVKQFDTFYGRKLRPLIGDPDKDKRINLFAAQGRRWKRLRTLSSPSFSMNSLKKIRSTVEECGTEIMWHLEQKIGNGEEIEMLKCYQEYTLGVISRVALGMSDAQMFKNPLLEKVSAVFNNSQKVLFFTGIFPPVVGPLRKFNSYLPEGTVPAFTIFGIIEKAIRKRMAQRESDLAKGIEPAEPQDFIDLFLDARTDVEHLGEQNDHFSKRTVERVSRELTVDEIIGQCFVFLVAGFDTTAISMAYATFLLATNPDVQSKLQEEIDRECAEPEIGFEQLARLKYLDVIMKETLRLFPLGTTANTRKCMRDTTVNGLKIEEGVHVQVDTWTLHHNPNIWGDDVEQFRPERWESSKCEQLEHSGAYIPFGSGPRQCIGMRLAQMEQKILLAQILKQYSFRPSTSTQIPVKLVGALTVAPESVYVKLEPR